MAHTERGSSSASGGGRPAAVAFASTSRLEPRTSSVRAIRRAVGYTQEAGLPSSEQQEGFVVADLLDVVEFRVGTDSWESKTTGTVVEVSGDRVLVEVTDPDGRTLDVVSLPRDAVRRLEIPDQERLRI